MSEEGAPRRSTRSLSRRQSTDTPSPPPLGGTPVKRVRSARLALLSSIAETNAPANNVAKAVEENIENNQDSSKQRSSSLTTVDSPKPKRGRRSLLTEEAVASLEPVRRSRRLSTSSEVSVEITEDVSRSSTPVKGVTRRTRRLSIDSEDNSNPSTTRVHTVSALPVVEVIQEEEPNILSTNGDDDFLNTSKHANIVDQFAVSSEPNVDVIIIEPEVFSPALNTSSEKSIKTEITPIKSEHMSQKTPVVGNSNTVCQSFTTKSPDSPTSQPKQTENVTPVVEQLKSKTPGSCEIEITITDPTNRTKSLTDIGDLNTSGCKNASPVSQLDSAKISKVDVSEDNNSDVSKAVTGSSNSSKNEPLKFSPPNEDKKEQNSNITEDIEMDKLPEKTLVPNKVENNLDNTSECENSLQLSVDTSNSLMVDSNNIENVENVAETSSKSNTTSNEKPLSPVSENAFEEKEIYKSPQPIKNLHEQTLNNNDLKQGGKLTQSSHKVDPNSEKGHNEYVTEPVEEISQKEQNTSITSHRKSNIAIESKENSFSSSSLEKNVSATILDEESMGNAQVSEKELNVSVMCTKEGNLPAAVITSPISEKALNQTADSEKDQNSSFASGNELNISGKEVNTSAGPEQEIAVPNTSPFNLSDIPENKLNVSTVNEKRVSAVLEKKIDSFNITEKKEDAISVEEIPEKQLGATLLVKEINATTFEKELTHSTVENEPMSTEEKLNISASAKDLNVSPVSKREPNKAARLSAEKLNVSSLSEKELNVTTQDEGMDVSAISEKEIIKSAITEELNQSVVTEEEQNHPVNPEKDLNVSLVSEKESDKARLSAEELNVSSLSEKELNESTQDKAMDMSTISEKEIKKSTATEELNQSTVTEEEQKISENSAEDLNISLDSKKESNKARLSAEKLNVSSLSEKELNELTHDKVDTSTISEKEIYKSTASKELNQSAVTENEQKFSVNSVKVLNVSPASKMESKKERLSSEKLNISSLSEEEMNASTHDEELNVSTIPVKEMNKSTATEQLNQSAQKEQNHSVNSQKKMNMSASCEKDLNDSKRICVDSKHELDNTSMKSLDEEKDRPECKEAEETENNTLDNAKKSQENNFDKETTSLVISDDSDIESECNTKEYLKLNSDSDSSDYVDKEAKDMGKDYESHDSMDDEEKDAERENKFLEAGESIESSDGEQLDDDYEHDSFCVESRSEDEELLEGESEDLDSRSSSGLSDLSQSQAAKDKYNSRRSKKRMSVILDSSSDMVDDCKDVALQIESDDEKYPESISNIINGSGIPAKDLPKTLSNATEEIKNIRNMSRIESDSSDTSGDMKIKNQYQDVLDELNSKHQVQNNEDALNTSKGTIKKNTSLNSPKTTTQPSVNEHNSQLKEKCSPIKTAIDDNNQVNSGDKLHEKSMEMRKNDENKSSELVKGYTLNGDASVECKSPSNDLVKTVSTKDCNKIAVEDSASEAICIDESESDSDVESKNQNSAISHSNIPENTEGSSEIQKGESKNPLKRKMKEQNKIDLSNIDLNKIQAACEQIMQKEIEKKRVRRESDNQSNTKKATKVLHTEKVSKLKRLPEATLKKLDEIELTSETVTKSNKSAKGKDLSVIDKQEKNAKQKNSANSSNNMKRLPEKTLDELFDSENESDTASPNSLMNLVNVNVKKNVAPSATKSTAKVFTDTTVVKRKENKTNTQSKSKKALPGTTLNEISNTSKKSNKVPLKKKSKLDTENIPKSTTYFEVTSIKKGKKGKKGNISPLPSTGFRVKHLKTKVIETSAEGCTTIFKIESSKKINMRAVVGAVVGNEAMNFKQNALAKSKIRSLEKGLIQAQKNKQRALASRK